MYVLRSFVRLLSHCFFLFSYCCYHSPLLYLFLSICCSLVVPVSISFTFTQSEYIDNVPSIVVNCNDPMWKSSNEPLTTGKKIEDDEEEDEKSIRIGMRIIILTSLFFSIYCWFPLWFVYCLEYIMEICTAFGYSSFENELFGNS